MVSEWVLYRAIAAAGEAGEAGEVGQVIAVVAGAHELVWATSTDEQIALCPSCKRATVVSDTSNAALLAWHNRFIEAEPSGVHLAIIANGNQPRDALVRRYIRPLIDGTFLVLNLAFYLDSTTVARCANIVICTNLADPDATATHTASTTTYVPTGSSGGEVWRACHAVTEQAVNAEFNTNTTHEAHVALIKVYWRRRQELAAELERVNKQLAHEVAGTVTPDFKVKELAEAVGISQPVLFHLARKGRET